MTLAAPRLFILVDGCKGATYYEITKWILEKETKNYQHCTITLKYLTFNCFIAQQVL
jgi:hypothetical protein